MTAEERHLRDKARSINDMLDTICLVKGRAYADQVFALFGIGMMVRASGDLPVVEHTARGVISALLRLWGYEGFQDPALHLLAKDVDALGDKSRRP